jgi:hypothetical protein
MKPNPSDQTTLDEKIEDFLQKCDWCIDGGSWKELESRYGSPLPYWDLRIELTNLVRDELRGFSDWLGEGDTDANVDFYLAEKRGK